MTFLKWVISSCLLSSAATPSFLFMYFFPSSQKLPFSSVSPCSSLLASRPQGRSQQNWQGGSLFQKERTMIRIPLHDACSMPKFHCKTLMNSRHILSTSIQSTSNTLRFMSLSITNLLLKQSCMLQLSCMELRKNTYSFLHYLPPYYRWVYFFPNPCFLIS